MFQTSFIWYLHAKHWFKEKLQILVTLKYCGYVHGKLKKARKDPN